MPVHTPNSYTIVLWCADESPFVSFAGAHLLHEGLSTANFGRVDDQIPVVVGVGNTRRLPIVSREVSARGILRARRPDINTVERHDYLLTFTSGSRVDAGSAVRHAPAAPVLRARELLAALEPVEPQLMKKDDILSLLNSLAHEPRHVRSSRDSVEQFPLVADLCQRLVASLNR